MVRIIFIPSYGTDSSLYQNLQESDLVKAQTDFVEWLPINKGDSLSDYARRFIDQYKITEKDIVVGVSLGGVLAIEINKLKPLRKIIVISSIKTKSEKPTLFRFMEKTKTYRLFKPGVLKFGLDLILPLYGKNVKSYIWFRRVFKSFDNAFLKWALREIVCWNNYEIPSNLISIHGTKDPLFSINNAKQVDYVIDKGTHAMIRLKAREIAIIINQECT